MRLFYHFSMHYDGHHLDRIVFKKRYGDLCAEWLGGITVLKHRSKILGEQLDIHLEQLVALGFLRSCALTPAEGREGFVLTFRPGDQFKADYAKPTQRTVGGRQALWQTASYGVNHINALKFHRLKQKTSVEEHWIVIAQRFGKRIFILSTTYCRTDVTSNTLSPTPA
jgi:hypothetical protein